jgi:hypothetical protein
MALGPFQIFSKICEAIRSAKCTTGVIDTGGNWKKSSIRKFSIFAWTSLLVELTYRHIFSLSSLEGVSQPGVSSLIFFPVANLPGVVDTDGKECGLKFMSSFT